MKPIKKNFPKDPTPHLPLVGESPCKEATSDKARSTDRNYQQLQEPHAQPESYPYKGGPECNGRQRLGALRQPPRNIEKLQTLKPKTLSSKEASTISCASREARLQSPLFDFSLRRVSPATLEKIMWRGTLRSHRTRYYLYRVEVLLRKFRTYMRIWTMTLRYGKDWYLDDSTLPNSEKPNKGASK